MGVVAGKVVIANGASLSSALDTDGLVPVSIQFPTPLKGTAATALNVACITTSAQVYVNAGGYQAP